MRIILTLTTLAVCAISASLRQANSDFKISSLLPHGELSIIGSPLD